MNTAIASDARARIVRREHLAATEVEGQVVMLDIDRGTYYGLGGAGSRLWTLLAQPRTLDELVQQMCADFAVDETACRADVLAFLKELIGHGLAEAQPA